MEIWSGTQFRATWHRVVCPNPPDLEPGQVLPGRKSVVFFMIPNHDVVSGVGVSTEIAEPPISWDGLLPFLFAFLVLVLVILLLRLSVALRCRSPSTTM
jgi:isopenicillin N synthase-like dioxygenase